MVFSGDDEDGVDEKSAFAERYLAHHPRGQTGRERRAARHCRTARRLRPPARVDARSGKSLAAQVMMRLKDLLRRLYQRCVDVLVGKDCVWQLLEFSLLRVTRRMERRRSEILKLRVRMQRETLVADFVREHVADLVTRHGPFTGLQYPRATAVGSVLVPKLIGCYECELHALIDELVSTKYQRILDVGAAEGYYAVGFALALPVAQVSAFDIDAQARKLCREMADLNGVSERVTVTGACSPRTLLALAGVPRSLVISDCEGDEKSLFTPAVVAALRDHDCLVEVHDFVDPSISHTLRARFEMTHALEVFTTHGDFRRAQEFDCEELVGIAAEARFELLAERRPGIMQWMFMRARNQIPAPLTDS